MKKPIFYVIIFFVYALDAQEHTPVNYKVRDIFTEFFFEYLGAKPVSEKMEIRVRDLLRKHNFSFADSLEMRLLNRYVIKNNAAVVAYWVQNHLMFLDEKWLSNVSDEEFEFVILHEATHLAEHHADSMFCTLLITPLVAGYATLFYSKSGPKSFLAWGAALCGTYFLLLPKLSRYLEYRADAGAIRCLHNIEGGIKTMNMFKEWEKDFDSHCSQLWILKLRRNIYTWIHDNLNFMLTHPLHDQRIAALHNIKLS